MKILVSGEIRELRYRDSNGLDTMYDILLAEKAIYDKKKGIPVLRKPEEFEDWKIFANEQQLIQQKRQSLIQKGIQPMYLQQIDVRAGKMTSLFKRNHYMLAELCDLEAEWNASVKNDPLQNEFMELLKNSKKIQDIIRLADASPFTIQAAESMQTVLSFIHIAQIDMEYNDAVFVEAAAPEVTP